MRHVFYQGFALLVLCSIVSPTVAQECLVGQEQWISGCRAQCERNWQDSNCPASCTATAPPGYVIVDYRWVDHGRKRGSTTISVIGQGQEFDYAAAMSRAYNSAFDMAVSAGKYGAAAQMRQEMDSALQTAERFYSSHNTVRMVVDAVIAGRPIIDEKDGFSNSELEIKVICTSQQLITQSLLRKYELTPESFVEDDGAAPTVNPGEQVALPEPDLGQPKQPETTEPRKGVEFLNAADLPDLKGKYIGYTILRDASDAADDINQIIAQSGADFNRECSYIRDRAPSWMGDSPANRVFYYHEGTRRYAEELAQALRTLQGRTFEVLPGDGACVDMSSEVDRLRKMFIHVVR